MAVLHDAYMSEHTSEWLTLSSYENVTGCPRPTRLVAD
jgi:hypothetical protein